MFLNLCTFLSLFIWADSQSNPFLNDAQVISQQGSLVKVSISRGEPIKLFVVGKKAAELDLSSSEWGLEFDPSDLTVRVRRVGPKLSQILKVERQQNFFVVETPKVDEKIYTLEVTTEFKGKKEQFNFRIDNRPK